MMEAGKSWILTVEQDPDSEDLYLQLPLDFLEVTGWQPGDVLDWIDNHDGTWQLKRKGTE